MEGLVPATEDARRAASANGGSKKKSKDDLRGGGSIPCPIARAFKPVK